MLKDTQDSGRAVKELMSELVPAASLLSSPDSKVYFDTTLRAVVSYNGRQAILTSNPPKVRNEPVMFHGSDMSRSEVMVPGSADERLSSRISNIVFIETAWSRISAEDLNARSLAHQALAHELDRILVESGVVKSEFEERFANQISNAADKARAGTAVYSDLPKTMQVVLDNKLNKFLSDNWPGEGFNADTTASQVVLSKVEWLASVSFYVQWPDGSKEGFEYSFRLP